MSQPPYIYNNRPTVTMPQNITRLPRQSQTLSHGNPYQFQPTKMHDSMGRADEPQPKNGQFKPYTNGQVDTGFGRVLTEPSTQVTISKPINSMSGHQNYNQQYQPSNNYYASNPQNSKVGGGQLFKSSIYGNNQSASLGSNGLSEKASLNLSGGKANNIGVTPPRKLPRISEPSLPSDMNYYMEYMKGNNNNSTAESPPSVTTQKEQASNFNKIRQFVVDSPNTIKNVQTQQKKETDQSKTFLEKKQSLLSNITSPTRRSSVDLSEVFHRPTNNVFPHRRKFKFDDFIKIKQLGSGKYGRVYLVRDKASGYICALKCVQKKLLVEEQITEQFIRELKIQMYLNHPHIIKLYGFFDDADAIYLILEVGTGGQLFHQLKKQQAMPQLKVASFMRQICDAVSQIHSLRIIHRDIKPQNIVIHDNVLKLCDFGWSVHQDKNLRTTFCGTPLYVCPQILKGKQYDQKIDIWSLGIMMYEMLIGENPFKITKEEQLIKIIKDEIVVPSYISLSKEARDFLDKCLKKNPNDRVTIRELMDHDFFKKYPDKQSEKSKMIAM